MVMVNVQRLPKPLLDVYAWQEHGLCRAVETDAFFGPDDESRGARERRERRAKRVCARCPVQQQCLSFAMQVREPDGIWGGLTARERFELEPSQPKAG